MVVLGQYKVVLVRVVGRFCTGQFGTGQFGTWTIWHQGSKNGQFGTKKAKGQFGTKTKIHQNYSLATLYGVPNAQNTK